MLRDPIITLLLLCTGPLHAQDVYFPPTVGNTWETVDLEALNWCPEGLMPLHDFLATSNTKAFMVLKDGRIALEWYYGTFTQDSLWYWASAGKSVTAFLVGKAQEEGLLSIAEPSSNFLGPGWTSCTPEQEEQITVWHQLTMTTGLDDGVPDVDCTDPGCLTYLAPPGTRWAYHNAPYTLLDGVLASATGTTLNGYLASRLNQPIGMGGFYLPIGSNNVLFSKARGMARFGLMMMAGGSWNGVPVMNDTDYLQAMISPSQDLNQAYGYLWWLNGQPSYMLPGLQFVFNGPLMPNAPLDAFNAMGKNGQLINVSPSSGLVVVRMGDLPGGIFVPNVYNDQIWQYLNAVICAGTGTGEESSPATMELIPLGNGLFRLNGIPASHTVRVFNTLGQPVHAERSGDVLRVHSAAGSYLLHATAPGGRLRVVRFAVH